VFTVIRQYALDLIGVKRPDIDKMELLFFCLSCNIIMADLSDSSTDEKNVLLWLS
jgi:hypothetical protein